MSQSSSKEEERLNRHVNADPTTAKCVGGLHAKPAEPAEPAGDEALSREEERLARHVASSNARAKVVEKESAPTEDEQAKMKCVVCRKVGGGKFCLVEMKRNAKAPVHCDCFSCYECGNELAGANYGEDTKGHLMCAPCLKAASPDAETHTPASGTQAEVCGKCGDPILESQAKVRAMGSLFHQDCFACDACGSKIHTGCFKGDGGKLYCSEACARREAEAAAKKDCPCAGKAEEKADAKVEHKFCSVCGKEFVGQFVVVGGQPMHPDCFVCGKCGQKLGSQVFNVDGKMCCKACAEQK